MKKDSKMQAFYEKKPPEHGTDTNEEAGDKAYKTYVISLYPHFHCYGGDCPHSCCKGWSIPVDEGTMQRYRTMPGAYGRALRFHVWHLRGMDLIQKQLGRCPHWNSDHLCQFQVNGEPELMPLICRVYPRDAVRSDVETEVTMELSCISMARTFLEHPGRLYFIPTEDVIESTWEMDNNEPDFYAYLKQDRERMLDYLWDGGRELRCVWQSLYAYVYQVHDLIVRDRVEEAKAVVLSDRVEDMGIYYLNREPTYSFFSIQTIDRMILDQIDYGNLKWRERAFYRLIQSYRRRFSDLYVDEAERFFDEQAVRLIEAGYGEKYRSYFSYCMQELYLKAYETYHVLRQFLFAVLYVQLLMLFDMVDYLDRGGQIADIDRQSEILMLCEQGIRHNPQLTKNLLAIIREEFL